MFRWRKILWLSLLLLGGLQMFAASFAEKHAFNAAAYAFGFSSWPYAETNFARFVQEYPQSERFAEAVLFQAQARYYMRQYDAAIALLSANQGKAGWWADQYLYWIAEAQLAGGNVAAAADSFARVAESFPASTNRLSACVREAEARARLQNWPRVIELLQKPDGIFQQAIKSGATGELAAAGCLMLGEAQLAQKDFAGANGTLAWLVRQDLNPNSAWQRGYLEYRVRLAEDQVEAALQSTTNMIASARAAKDSVFLARGVAMQADILERLGRLDEAVATYTNNLAAGVPADQQRVALLKIAELSLAQDKISDAVQTLGNFLNQYTNSAAADVALLALGEFQLKQFLTDSATTNLLDQAAGNFGKLLSAFPESSLAGKAWLNKGWCLWLQGQFAQSREAFQNAALRLPFSEEQAVARFKWADAQFKTNDFAGALTNYNYLVTNYAALPQVKEQMLETALYQTVRAALETGDLDAATNALEKILAWYPQGFAGDRSLLLTGQGFSRKKDPARARELFARFAEMYPTNALSPEVRLATARNYEQEKNWDAAITNYDAWISSFTNHPEQPAAEFSRARDNFMAGRETNAFVLFTNFVGQFRTNPLALRAQWWIGDYYFRQGGVKFKDAEENYLWVFKSTNWPPSELTYQAQMMAGRAAVARLNYKDATNYFSNLATDSNCPIQLRFQATFACGDALMSRTDSAATNHQGDLDEAIKWFRSIAENYPTNEFAPLAWGRMGDCYLQMAAAGTNLFYDLASNAYQQVLTLPLASVAARSQAKVGLGIVSEKLAMQKSSDEKTDLFKQAFDDYQDVFLGNNYLREGEQRDLFWVKEAGLHAFQAASEDLNDWPLALNICSNLAGKFPQLRSVFENKMRLAQEHLAKEKK
jgi:TolA-binding protein